MRTLITLPVILCLAMSACTTAHAPLESAEADTLVIGHRGSPGFGQENTIAGFRRAVELGAEGIELDLILTKDHHLVVLHDWTLNRLVGIDQLETHYPARNHLKEGKRVWRTRDFTLDELVELRVTQTGPCASSKDPALSDGDTRICSYADALHTFKQLRRLNPDLVLYTEIKTSAGEMSPDEIDLAAALVADALHTSGELAHHDNHWIQSFDARVMDRLAANPALDSLRLCQLLSCEPGLITSANPVILDVAEMHTEQDLAEFLTSTTLDRDLHMVHGWKLMWWHLLEVKDIDCARVAHSLGIDIHAFTFRDDRYASDYADRPVLVPGGNGFSSASDEADYFRAYGFDALMSDCIESALPALADPTPSPE